MNITVYLGANKTEDPHIRKAAEELGVWIAANGHTLVYGGSKSGLMGTLAFAVVENGGKAIGVEPQMSPEQRELWRGREPQRRGQSSGGEIYRFP